MIPHPTVVAHDLYPSFNSAAGQVVSLKMRTIDSFNHLQVAKMRWVFANIYIRKDLGYRNPMHGSCISTYLFAADSLKLE